jgi:hypothetical protein
MMREAMEKMRSRKRIWMVSGTLLILITFVLLSGVSSWACEGEAHPGYDVVMKMIDPFSGETFATVTFDEITEAGKAKMTESNLALKSPSPYQLQTPPVLYDISSTADYSGTIEVCVNYKAIGLRNASALQVSHHENGSWVALETTLKWKKNIVCGTASSLSHFAIFEDPRRLYGPGIWFHNAHTSR